MPIEARRLEDKTAFKQYPGLEHFGTADRYADWSAAVDVWYTLNQIDLRRYPKNHFLKLWVRSSRAAVRKLLQLMRQEYWDE